MFGFGGGKKSAVDYGGSRRDETPLSLHVSQQREARAHEKARIQAVLKLQSIYRARVDLRACQIKFRAEFDGLIPRALANPTPQAARKMISYLAFFFDPLFSSESSRLMLLSTLLARSKYQLAEEPTPFLKMRRRLISTLKLMSSDLLVTTLQLLLHYQVDHVDHQLLFHHVRAAIKSHWASRALVNGLVAFALQCVTPTSAPRFTYSILGIDGVARALTEPIRRQVASRGVAPCALGDRAARRSALVNVLSLLQPKSNDRPSRGLILLVANIVSEDQLHIFPICAGDDSEDSDESEEEGNVLMESDGDTELLRLLSPLWRVFSTVLNTCDDDDELFLSLCRMFQVVTLRDSSELNLLAYSSNNEFLPRLWQFISSHDPDGAPVTITIFFCRVYSQLLTLLDDQDFFEGRMFSLDVLTRMITFIKAPVLKLPAKSPLKVALTLLLNRLYERDNRRPFCPPDHWINRALDSESITRDLINRRLSDATLEVIETVPFFMPFLTRVDILQRFIEQDRGPYWRERGGGARITIRRDHLFEDSFAAFQKLTRESRLKDALRITFVSAQGLPEAGVDGGGVFREFVQSLVAEGFGSPDLPLFLNTQDNHIYPNPAMKAKQYQAYYEFLGIVLGKAMYESLLVDVPFASFFLSKLLGKKNTLHDLSSLDQDLYRNLVFMKNYKQEDFEETFGLTFSITDDDFGRKVTRDLIPNGSKVPVTLKNKLYYVYQMAHYRLNKSIYIQSRSFVRGFARFLPLTWLKLFSASELLVLIRGEEGDIDVDDWERNTVYSGGFHPSQPPIKMFWRVVREELSAAQRRLLLKFVTSCSRPPLRGFASLEPKFCISQRGGGDLYLPSAGTCMNLLKLPRYTSTYTLKRQLVLAIESGSGFELS